MTSWLQPLPRAQGKRTPRRKKKLMRRGDMQCWSGKKGDGMPGLFEGELKSYKKPTPDSLGGAS